MGIEIFGPYGDPREQASRAQESRDDMFRRAQEQAMMKSAGYDDHIHGMTPTEIARLRQRFEKFIPQFTSGAPYTRAKDFFGKMLPKGANLDPGAGAGLMASMQRSKDLAFSRRTGQTNMPYGGMLSGNSLGGGSFATGQRPYQPEFESPDRQNYPIHRNLANIYWRVFYKLDPIIGTCVDLFSEMPWSDYTLSGEGVDGEIKDTLEEMDEETQLRSMLPYFIKEFMVIGEVAPHLFYDDDRGMWTHIAIHNPDQLEVIYSPFLRMEPVVEFRPDDKLRAVLTSPHPQLQHVRETMPPEVLNALMSGQNIPLSPINLTFIPRKLHPYDVRGTSIISRMWRILMYEDSIFNASIAIARRAAAPLKVAKLGDRMTGWIPDPSQERRLLELLTQAEVDPAAWLVYHFGIEFDLVGSQERAWKIEQTADFIERTKLLAMGISKAFLHGEVTYASAASGLTVFLQRLKALREFFESQWIYPKYYRPVAEMNAWIKPTEAELSHKVRTKRSRRELVEGRRYIIPTIEWDRPLDPSIDSAMINAVQALHGLGVPFSPTTLASLVNRDFETELEQSVNDAKTQQEMMAKHPELQMMMQPGAEGGPGGGVSPGMPPGMMGMPPEGAEVPEGGEVPPPPPMEEGGPPPEAAPNQQPDEGHGGTEPFDENGRYGAWEKPEVEDLADVLRGDWPEEEPWTRMVEEWQEQARSGGPYEQERARRSLLILKDGDPAEVWDEIQDWLFLGYPTDQIRDLEDILRAKEVLAPKGGGPGLVQASQLLENANDLVGDTLFTGVPQVPRRR
jgi:hypothetical protein